MLHLLGPPGQDIVRYNTACNTINITYTSYKSIAITAEYWQLDLVTAMQEKIRQLFPGVALCSSVHSGPSAIRLTWRETLSILS